MHNLGKVMQIKQRWDIDVAPNNKDGFGLQHKGFGWFRFGK